MSYDVYVGGDETADPNYTSNLHKLLYTHIPDTGKGGGMRELHETRNEQVISILTNFQVSVAKEIAEIGWYEMTKKYEPDNKWGSIEGVLEFTHKIIRAAMKNPNEFTRVSM